MEGEYIPAEGIKERLFDDVNSLCMFLSMVRPKMIDIQKVQAVDGIQVREKYYLRYEEKDEDSST